MRPTKDFGHTVLQPPREMPSCVKDAVLSLLRADTAPDAAWTLRRGVDLVTRAVCVILGARALRGVAQSANTSIWAAPVYAARNGNMLVGALRWPTGLSRGPVTAGPVMKGMAWAQQVSSSTRVRTLVMANHTRRDL